MDELIIPVPEMLKRRNETKPSCLFEVEIAAGVKVLVAETDAGYVGLPLQCPHKLANLRLKGVIDPRECVVLCEGDFITFSLESGEAVRNVGAQGEDPGRLKLFKVTRTGDNFVIPSGCLD
jgi:nitrite reductase/ring-hydroxylating ferredoxin subunit